MIIKADQVRIGGHEPRSEAFNLSDMSSLADNYLDTVREQAEGIVDQAKQQAVQLQKQAVIKGQETATQAALQKMKQQFATLQTALQKAAAEIREAKQAWLKNWEDKTVHLATRIAEKIIRREIANTPEVPAEFIREALQLAAGSGEITLYLNPNDLKGMEEILKTLIAESDKPGSVEVVADPSVTPAGCRVVTQFGEIDQQIESQLSRIEQELA